MLRALIGFCVHRRIGVLMVSLVVVAYGLLSYYRTPIEAYPDVTNIQVNVITQYPGLAAEEIERQVTIPLERVLNGTPGLILIRSESLFGLSLVWLVFQDDADGFRARALVSERIATASLPPGATAELAPDYTPLGEVYQYRVTSDRHTLTDLRMEQEWTVTRVMRQVPGVADVVSFGGYLKELHVQVDPKKLLAFDLTLDDVSEALAKSNENVGGGFLTNGDQEFVIRGVGYLMDARDVEHIVLRSQSGTPITVGDVATVVVAHTPRRGDVGYNGKLEAVEGFVLLRRGQDPSPVLKAIHEKVDELNSKILPEGMKIEPFYDRTSLVGLTLSTVKHNLLFGALLVIAVVWLIIGSLRCSLIVASVIPLAVLAAFIGLYLLGLPANMISMGAIDFGILVEAAVVLTENVIREMSERQVKTRAELRSLVGGAALGVAMPTFFAMAIIIAALIPVFALERVEGRIFRPLAMTYSFALVGALVFALTTVTALCAAFFRLEDGHHKEPRWLIAARDGYAVALRWLFSRRSVVVGGLIAIMVMGGIAISRVGSEFLPDLDEGDLLLFVEMPTSISLERGSTILVDVRRRLLTFPEVTEVLSEHGRPEDGTDEDTPNLSETFVRLKPHDQWRKGWNTERLIEAMRESLTEIPGVRYNFSQPIRDNVEEAVSGVRGKFVLKIFGTDLAAMRESMVQAKRALGKVAGVVDLDLYRDATVPQLQIRLDRAALARAGVSVVDAQSLIETALGGHVATTLWEGERAVPIRLILPPSERQVSEQISSILVPTPGGGRVPLSELAHIETSMGRLAINRESNSRFLALKFNVEGRDIGSVMHDAMETLSREVKPPDGNYFVWAGDFENQQRAMSRLAVIVPISVGVVLLLLWMSLRSFRSAVTVLLSAPFAMTGGLFALWAAGIPLSVSAAVGFITLLGQVALQALLVIAVADERRRLGEDMNSAVLNGSIIRFRPVTMTALLAIMGLMPMALSQGVGSEIQRPFALVIIGGLFTSRLVTAFALPTIYAFISQNKLPDEEEDDEIEVLSPAESAPRPGV
ncbi:MAG: CusA/CzcA family heavy metal efflux RND transporter [Myxococcaceae bacterium]